MSLCSNAAFLFLCKTNQNKMIRSRFEIHVHLKIINKIVNEYNLRGNDVDLDLLVNTRKKIHL
jgi:hypothetical protein